MNPNPNSFFLLIDKQTRLLFENIFDNCLKKRIHIIDFPKGPYALDEPLWSIDLHLKYDTFYLKQYSFN